MTVSAATSSMAQFDDHPASLCVALVEEDAASEVLDMALGQSESETEAFGEVVDLRKHLKHTVALLLGDAGTFVLYDEADL